jgi:hypothetical protein
MRIETDPWYSRYRLTGLRTFAVAITLLNVVGHAFLGFETSWVVPIAALATAYAAETLLEALDARACGRPPRYAGGWGQRVDFLLPGHISALACAMLLYSNGRIGPVVFAVVVAVASKVLLRAPIGGKTRHFFNPSNLGITAALLLFPWVGIAPPYQFTENLYGPADWLLPAAIVVAGSTLNTRVTRRIPLILAWLVGFAVVALSRSLLVGAPPAAALVPMTGVAFVLFTFYMVTDPATTPSSRQGQIAFGAAVAIVYGILMAAHVVFGLIFALTLVCLGRGVWLYAAAWAESRASVPTVAPAASSAVAGSPQTVAGER